jgi:hypothetical protein
MPSGFGELRGFLFGVCAECSILSARKNKGNLIAEPRKDYQLTLAIYAQKIAIIVGAEIAQIGLGRLLG